MQKHVATIFNNVMGPIGVGPSTSNTCGPCRIAYLASKIACGELKSAKVIFPADSGYATPNGKGMRSDYAFAHGLLGRLPDSAQPLLKAFDEIKSQGIDLSFEIDDRICSSGEHLMSVIELITKEGKQTKVCGLSKGGGAIEIIGIDEFKVSINGEHNMLLAFLNSAEEKDAEAQIGQVQALYPELREYPARYCAGAGRMLLLFPLHDPPSRELVETVMKQDGVEHVIALPSILPVIVLPEPRLPYRNADELERYCAENGKSLAEAAIEYETAVSGLERDRIRAFAASALTTMRDSIRHGLSKNLQFEGIIKPSAAILAEKAKQRIAIDDGVVSKAAIYALAIMEYSNASGVVVCMPTAGASGTVAGALLGSAEQLESSEEEIVDAILAAGGVGVSISEENDFCGGVYGCQAEVGCAAAMAAAGVVTLSGGTVQQALNAASMALQNMLGLICDPVCGLVQVPCFARNISAVSNAITCANMSMLGFDATIPLQDAFEAMKASGSCLPVKLRGCGGGLCETAAGQRLLQEYHKSL